MSRKQGGPGLPPGFPSPGVVTQPGCRGVDGFLLSARVEPSLHEDRCQGLEGSGALLGTRHLMGSLPDVRTTQMGLAKGRSEVFSPPGSLSFTLLFDEQQGTGGRDTEDVHGGEMQRKGHRGLLALCCQMARQTRLGITTRTENSLSSWTVKIQLHSEAGELVTSRVI